MFPVDIAKFLRKAFLYNISGGCFWKSCHSAVRSAGVPFLWFCASTCFPFWWKTSTIRNFAQIILYYHVTKQFLACFNWLVTISEYVLGKTLIAFDFDEKHNIMCQKISSPALCDWSGAFNFRVWFGKRKNESKNMVLKTWPWEFRIWFSSAFLYFADLFCILSLLYMQVVLIVNALVDGFSSFYMDLCRFTSF